MRVIVRIDHERSPVKVKPEQLSDIRRCVNRCLRCEAAGESRGCVASLLSPGDSVEVGIAIVADEEIRVLNRQYRGIDSATDVLSFWSDIEIDEVQRLRECGDALPLGDVVVSADRAVEQATRYGHSLRREIVYLVVHGVLHLLGYTHQSDVGRSIMRRAEEKVLSDLGIRREPEVPEQ